MPVTVERLEPKGYRRIPWKNGGGELVVIADSGGEGWRSGGFSWHFGRTTIAEPGPFSDLAGFERLQVVIRGRGLVLVTPTNEIDLRSPFKPRRYDGGTPIVTRLEDGGVEVVNLIADRRRFDINLRVIEAGEGIDLAPGDHIVHAADQEAHFDLDGQDYSLAEDHALRLGMSAWGALTVARGRVVIGSVYVLPTDRPQPSGFAPASHRPSHNGP
jgi:environmental stress-induced protein Ves